MIKYLKYLRDLVHPPCVYAAVYTSYHPWSMTSAPVYFRTERDALRYINHQVLNDPAIYNGAADIVLHKYKFI